MTDPCPHCDGSGLVDGRSAGYSCRIRCLKCNGTGEVPPEWPTFRLRESVWRMLQVLADIMPKAAHGDRT
jgi:hypothetical protein